MQTLNPETGGVARAVTSLSKGLQQHSVQTEIVALDRSDSPWLREQRVAVHALGEGLTSYRYSRALSSWLRKNGDKFDCVVVHGIWQHHSFAVWQRFHKTATPYFVFPHGMLDPWFKRTYPLKHLKKWLYWPWAEYRILRDAAAVIFTSEQERDEAREHLGGEPVGVVVLHANASCSFITVVQLRVVSVSPVAFATALATSLLITPSGHHR